MFWVAGEPGPGLRRTRRRGAERFPPPFGISEDGRRLLATASLVAAWLGHRRVEVAHLVWALTFLKRTVAGAVLSEMTNNPDRVVAAASSFLPSGRRRPVRNAKWSPWLKGLLADSAEIAAAYHAPRVNSGHLVLALLAEGSGLLRRMLRSAGLDPEVLRRRLVDRIDALEDETCGRVHRDDDLSFLRTQVLAARRTIAGGRERTALWAGPENRHRGCRLCREPNPPEARYCRSCGTCLNARTAGGRSVLEAYLCMVSEGQEHFGRPGAGPGAALACFRAAHRLIRDDPRALLGIARAHAAMGHRARALRFYRRVLERDPACAAAWAGGADCFDRYAFLRRARWLTAAAALRPHDAALKERLAYYVRRLRWWERWFVPSERRAGVLG